jgi:xanthine dehydrogenase accessory factor
MDLKVLIRGAGDLASGVGLRLAHCGFKILMTELEQPLVVRRSVSFAEAIYTETIQIEDIKGIRINSLEVVKVCWDQGAVPVLPDPAEGVIGIYQPDILIDARMLKRDLVNDLSMANLIIGLGPGFIAGKNCHAFVETKRGPFLGRVYWQGEAEKDTGIPEVVNGHSFERVLWTPVKGVFHAFHQIGDIVEEGDVIGDVDGVPIQSPFKGIIRGLIYPGIAVDANLKIGDIDPRCDPQLVSFVSDKALAIGGGVLEAIFSRLKIF